MAVYAQRVPQGKGATYAEREAMASLEEAYRAAPREPARGVGVVSFGSNGHKPTQGAGAAAAEGEPQPETEERRKTILGAEYVKFLASAGYTFSLCALDDSLWINGSERMTDPLEAEIRTEITRLGAEQSNHCG